jgi:hypothetical protein
MRPETVSHTAYSHLKTCPWLLVTVINSVPRIPKHFSWARSKTELKLWKPGSRVLLEEFVFQLAKKFLTFKNPNVHRSPQVNCPKPVESNPYPQTVSVTTLSIVSSHLHLRFHNFARLSYFTTSIMFLDIIHRPVYFENNVSETGSVPVLR